MKKLLSTHYSAGAFNFAMLVLRIGTGVLLMHHGYDKLIHFSEYREQFMSFLGLGKSLSLALVVFAEFFCSMFLILGLFTRFATIPILIAMCVALFEAHGGDYFGKGELATHYIIGSLVLLIIGPGRISVDGLIGK
jgi:putative oxidoreductase